MSKKAKDQEVFYSINSQLELKEYDTLENAIKSNAFVIVLQTYGYTHKTWAGNLYDVYNYVFLNNSGEQEYPKQNKWQMIDASKGKYLGRNEYQVSSTKSTIWAAGFYAKYKDPQGQIRKRIVFGPTDALFYLNKISKYSSWDEFLLNEENTNLKKKIEYLEAIIASLKKEK